MRATIFVLCVAGTYMGPALSQATVLQIFESPDRQEEGRFGWSVGGVDDTNDNGSSDILIGACGEGSSTALERAGRGYLFDDLVFRISLI